MWDVKLKKEGEVFNLVCGTGMRVGIRNGFPEDVTLKLTFEGYLRVSQVKSRVPSGELEDMSKHKQA